jgi:hypothetical protein
MVVATQNTGRIPDIRSRATNIIVAEVRSTGTCFISKCQVWRTRRFGSQSPPSELAGSCRDVHKRRWLVSLGAARRDVNHAADLTGTNQPRLIGA